MLTVRDALDCQFRIGYLVSINTAVPTMMLSATEVWWQPNPSYTGRAEVVSPNHQIRQATLHNISGKLIQTFAPSIEQIYAAEAGIYLVQTELNNNLQVRRKWVVYQ